MHLHLLSAAEDALHGKVLYKCITFMPDEMPVIAVFFFSTFSIWMRWEECFCASSLIHFFFSVFEQGIIPHVQEWLQISPVKRQKQMVTRTFFLVVNHILSLSLSLSESLSATLYYSHSLFFSFSVFSVSLYPLLFVSLFFSLLFLCQDSLSFRPWDTVACCWEVKQPTNKHSLSFSVDFPMCVCLCVRWSKQSRSCSSVFHFL